MEITDFQIEFDTYSRSFKSILFFGKMEYLENEHIEEKYFKCIYAYFIFIDY